MNPYQTQARLFKLLAHPVRLQILDLLRRDSECVCHLTAVLGKPQPYVSQQLAILRRAGVIEDVKEKNNVFYRLKDDRIRRQLDLVIGALPAVEALPSAPEGCRCPKCAVVLNTAPIRLANVSRR